MPLFQSSGLAQQEGARVVVGADGEALFALVKQGAAAEATIEAPPRTWLTADQLEAIAALCAAVASELRNGNYD